MSVYDQRGPCVRIAYLAIALMVWILSGLGRFRRGRVITLCYHGVTDRQRRRFARQMRHIAARAIALHAIRSAKDNHRSLPRICVTFDDGFANLLENALPVTESLGIPTAIFIVTRNLGSRPRWDIDGSHPEADEITMRADQVRQAAESGVCRFGSHGLTHEHMTHLPAASAELELVQSRAELEKMIGRAVEDFAFPHGECSGKLTDAAFAAGYRRVHTLDPSTAGRRGGGDVIGRMSMSPDAWPIEFALTAAGAYDWLPAVRRITASMRGPRRPSAVVPRCHQVASVR